MVGQVLTKQKSEEPMNPSSDSPESPDKARDSRAQKDHEASGTRTDTKSHGAHINERTHKGDTEHLHEGKENDVQIEEWKAKYNLLRQEFEGQSQRPAEEVRQHDSNSQQQRPTYGYNLQQHDIQIRKLN
ncbi:hypothetical protein BDV33DRAFT_210929 [Aspergillus novoparasiticus]|uniref:Uncharacterized protein n=1 Tax=Aspergillus novoparasiticus TaxID=986946 RepID=A0A5N6E5A8_9EURO|nr:hypothetical protein BDV33DRAFT_210929 [Aspergillus novoparasiticus]